MPCYNQVLEPSPLKSLYKCPHVRVHGSNVRIMLEQLHMDGGGYGTILP